MPPQPIVPPQTPMQTPVVLPAEKRSTGKLIMFFILGILVILALVGGVYWYLSSLQSSNASKTSVESTPVPVIEQQALKEDLQAELDNINIATDESDLIPVDQDLQGL